MRAKSILIGVLAGMVALSGCTAGGALQTSPVAYGGLTDAGFRIPPVPIYKVDQKFLRQTVPYATDVVPKEMPKSLLVMGSGAIGIEFASFYRTMGAEVTVVELLPAVMPVEDAEVSKFAQKQFEKQGMKIILEAKVTKVEKGANSVTAHVEMKRQWPDWSAPSAMIVRERNRGHVIPAHMGGGLMNPLGARALYLFNEKGDTGYRLHGSPEWWSIGKAVSAGCIRLMNQDIIDLYDRAEIGTKVIVI